MTMQELSDEMRRERARCSTHCGTWNKEDKDCEIYGEQHCPPSKCRYFLATELARRNKELEKQESGHKTKYIEACKICDNRHEYCKFNCNCSTLVRVEE